MKKILGFVSAGIIGIVACAGNVNAATSGKKVLTCEATESNGKILVSGTVEEGMLAVAISVYKKDESKPRKVVSDAVKDNTYSYEIEKASGDYVVKVADYDGGDFCQAKLAESVEPETTPTPVQTSEDEKKDVLSPDTGRMTEENSVAAMAVPIVATVAAVGMIIGIVAFLKKRRG